MACGCQQGVVESAWGDDGRFRHTTMLAPSQGHALTRRAKLKCAKQLVLRRAFPASASMLVPPTWIDPAVEFNSPTKHLRTEVLPRGAAQQTPGTLSGRLKLLLRSMSAS